MWNPFKSGFFRRPFGREKPRAQDTNNKVLQGRISKVAHPAPSPCPRSPSLVRASPASDCKEKMETGIIDGSKGDEGHGKPSEPSFITNATRIKVEDQDVGDDSTMKIDELHSYVSSDEDELDYEDDDRILNGENIDDAGDDAKDQQAESDWEIGDEDFHDYLEAKHSVAGYENWTPEESKLYRLLSLRGQHPLMPATWSRDFTGVPMPPLLFAPPDSDKSVLIQHSSNQFRATKAMASLFDLPSRINGCLETGKSHKVSSLIRRQIERYVSWAMCDAGLDNYEIFPNITVREFRPVNLDDLREGNAAVKKEDEDGGKGETPQPDATEDEPPRDGEQIDADKDDDKSPIKEKLSPAHRQQVELARRVEDYFNSYARRYRRFYARRGMQSQRPRVLFLLAIYQHGVMVLTKDSYFTTSSGRGASNIFAQFNLAREPYWLDSALGLAIPVHLAREELFKTVRSLPKSPPRKNLDPDA